jgi:small GTP-binding protein
MRTEILKSKICLVGDSAVGKSSLVRRYVLNAFDETYAATLGTHVSKKTVDIDLPVRDLRAHMDLLIWDIMGQKGFRELLKDAYFYGARGILAVADVTRRTTLFGLDDWIEGIESISGEIPIFIVANKSDLDADSEVEEREIAEVAEAYGSGFLRTSAKTGDNVEEAFRRLGARVAEHQLETGEKS